MQNHGFAEKAFFTLKIIMFRSFLPLSKGKYIFFKFFLFIKRAKLNKKIVKKIYFRKQNFEKKNNFRKKISKKIIKFACFRASLSLSLTLTHWRVYVISVLRICSIWRLYQVD